MRQKLESLSTGIVSAMGSEEYVGGGGRWGARHRCVAARIPEAWGLRPPRLACPLAANSSMHVIGW